MPGLSLYYAGLNRTSQPRGASSRAGVRKRLGPRPGGSELSLLCRSYRRTSIGSDGSLHESASRSPACLICNLESEVSEEFRAKRLRQRVKKLPILLPPGATRPPPMRPACSNSPRHGSRGCWPGPPRHESSDTSNSMQSFTPLNVHSPTFNTTTSLTPSVLYTHRSLRLCSLSSRARRNQCVYASKGISIEWAIQLIEVRII
jgi:hypothetical protein